MKNCLKFGNFIAPERQCALRVEMWSRRETLILGCLPCPIWNVTFSPERCRASVAPLSSHMQHPLSFSYNEHSDHAHKRLWYTELELQIPDLLKMVCLCCFCRPGVDMSHHFCLSFISFPGRGWGGERPETGADGIFSITALRITPADWMWRGGSKDHQLCPPRSTKDVSL